jgi:hypothetical protein
MVAYLEKKIRRNPNIAVFSRNYPEYLEVASKIAIEHPERLITFRAVTTWKSAQIALNFHNTIPIYFACVGGKGIVEYEAVLHTIYLNPKRGNKDTERLLALSLDETKDEGLWEKYNQTVHTLYVIRQCKKLPDPFPMTSLVKITDDKSISKNYGYSYSLVYKYSGAPKVDVEIHPEEVKCPEKYFEGTTRQISVNAYERNPKARNKCIEHYGFNCSVCGFNFQREFGKLGSGFIHVHHLNNLSDVKEKVEVDPIQDLRPVCPNCHAMLHKRNPLYSTDELKEIREKSRRPRS